MCKIKIDNHLAAERLSSPYPFRFSKLKLEKPKPEKPKIEKPKTEKPKPEKQQQQQQQKTSRKVVARIEPDILTVFTHETKALFNSLSSLTRKFTSSSYYRILTRTTQPAHLAVIVGIIFLSTVLYPLRNGPVSTNSTYKFVYVTATAIHYGSQIWMTFISGLSLYFSLPRHDFGEVQKVLFPIYFAFTGLLSAAALFSQSRISGLTGTTFLLCACFLVELLVRARFCGPLVALIIKKNKMEARHGLGREVGKLSGDSVLFTLQHYVSLHKQFRRLHMVIAIANMICIGLSTLHIWIVLQDCQQCWP